MNSELAKLKTSELIDLALAEAEPWDYDYIPILQQRGSKDVLLAAQELCSSPKVASRKLGVDILGQLGTPERTFPDCCLNTLLKLLSIETNEEVLYSIGVAFGHLKNIRAIQPLTELKNHPDADVRYGVVMGLLTHENSFAIETLIELSTDEDLDVRNWATFGLGAQIDLDTPEIRAALWQRLIQEDTQDSDTHEIYGEALVGLARREDTRIIPFILKELESNTISVLALEAAAEIGDVKLYPALIELRKLWDRKEYISDILDNAIASCKQSE